MEDKSNSITIQQVFIIIIFFFSNRDDFTWLVVRTSKSPICSGVPALVDELAQPYWRWREVREDVPCLVVSAHQLTHACSLKEHENTFLGTTNEQSPCICYRFFKQIFTSVGQLTSIIVHSMSSLFPTISGMLCLHLIEVLMAMFY